VARATGRSEAQLLRLAVERLVASEPAGHAPIAQREDPVAARHRPGPALVGVGVGPGDPGLVTRRAVEVLRDLWAASGQGRLVVFVPETSTGGLFGGWDAQVLVGQRIRILGKAGDVYGLSGSEGVIVPGARQIASRFFIERNHAARPGIAEKKLAADFKLAQLRRRQIAAPVFDE